MVYQFIFDIFLFNTNFNELQYWGIAITIVTFILDIYLTVKEPSETEQAAKKPTVADESIGQHLE